MSRVSRYKGCINNFINKRSCLSKFNNKSHKKIFEEHIKNSDYILPILLLTILNNRNKKNKIQFQGYFAAVSIEFLRVIMDISNENNNNRLIPILILMTVKSISQNIEIIKRHVKSDKILDSYLQVIDIVSNEGIEDILTEISTEPNKNIKNDICHYYFKDNKLLNKLSTFKTITEKSINNIIEKKACVIAQLAMSIAWILGDGPKDKMVYINKLGKYFGYMYQVATDFKNIEEDIRNNNDSTRNYVINCGFQNAYNVFMDNKEKFIEGAYYLDIYTNTLGELIEILESRIVGIIKKTSPDLVSSYSTLRPIV